MNLKNRYWYSFKGLPKHFCNDVIQYGKKQEVKDALIEETKSDLTEKNLKEQKESIRNSDVSWLNDKWVYDAIIPYFNDANKSCGWNFDIDFYETCQFTIYKDTNFYDWHIDMGNESYKEGPFKGTYRKLSMVLLLNDPNEFTGGTLQFDFRDIRDPNIHEYRFSKQGACVVFPSFLWHRVIPITKGTRYSLVTWATGKPFK